MLTGNPLSGNGSLRRRRGTKSRRSKHGPSATLWAVVCVLCLALIGALSLLAGLYTSLTAEEKSSLPDRMRHKVQAVPNLLRGNKPAEVPVGVGGGSVSRVEKPGHHLQPSASDRFRMDPSWVDKEQGGGTVKTSSSYPYPLDKVATAQEVSTYEPRGGSRFVEYTDGSSPYVITDAVRQASDALARSRRTFVKGMMEFAWEGYTKYAFGYDEVKPQSATGDNGWGGQGITLVDALDTLWLMGMKDEFNKARDWVRDHLDHSTTHFTSLFETTIRDLGGLLSAYDLSGEQVFLTKAIDLGNRLLHGFDNNPSGIPYGQVDLATGKAKNIGKFC